MFQKTFTERQLFGFELIIACIFCFMPLLFNNPYRINIFLSWEGAYRMYLGQMPFRDYSLPMGYAYWVLPALFFKIFGPYFYTLIITQAFTNLVSVFAFRGILKTLNVQPVVILLSVIVFCFSYISFNFWPWYNNVVFVYEIIGVYFILRAILVSYDWKVYLNLGLAAFFIFFSFFTKQDIGGIALLLALAILIYNAAIDHSFKKLAIFVLFYAVFAAVFILPLLKYDFSYWFNHGQPPHKSRLVVMDFANEILGWAYWEKFFLLMIVLFTIDKMTLGRQFFLDKHQVLLTGICVVIIGQAFIVPVTSPVPDKNEVFFYGFGFAYLFANLPFTTRLSRVSLLLPCLIFVGFWWSGIYWRNVQRVLAKAPVVVKKNEEQGHHKYRLAREYKSMEKLFLAENTLEGIAKIKNLDIVKHTPKEKLKVLNMSELTSLAYEMGFTPLINQPMWFHQTVSIFDKEVKWFCEKVKNQEYDLVIFESVSPKEVINFYPEDVHKCLDENYNFEFSFLAPRHPEESFVYVYTRKRENH
jgi:hypothetical protein